ncbi:MAG: XkdF-like putative serine protease domain-containing protein, partial [Vicinamibacterales bacterium]
MTDVQKRIVMRDGKHCVESDTTGRSFGCYATHAEAEARLAQIERFSRGTVDMMKVIITPYPQVLIPVHVDVIKVEQAQQNVFGWANVAFTADGEQIVDLQDDLIDVDDLEKAAYLFNVEFRRSGEMHRGDAQGDLIESFMVTPEKLEKMGLAADALPLGWWVGFHFDDTDVFDKVRDGTYSMFSI